MGFGWTRLGTGCSLSAVGLRNAYQDVYVGQLAGQGHVVETPVKQVFYQKGVQCLLKFLRARICIER